VAYRELVRGEGEEAHLALVGRDLSVGGMRIDPHPMLREGERLVLHLYGEASEEPLPVSGHVTRDQGSEGLAIRFDPLPSEAATRIEALVAGLPAVEPLGGGEAEALGAIVSRIVECEAHEDEEEKDTDPVAHAAGGAETAPDEDAGERPGCDEDAGEPAPGDPQAPMADPEAPSTGDDGPAR